MILSMLYLFIGLIALFFILSVYLMEMKPSVSIPFIMMGMIFCILVVYGLWNVEIPVMRSDDVFLLETVSYGDPYSYVFVLWFFIYLVMFLRAGFNMWHEALQTKGEMRFKR